MAIGHVPAQTFNGYAVNEFYYTQLPIVISDYGDQTRTATVTSTSTVFAAGYDPRSDDSGAYRSIILASEDQAIITGAMTRLPKTLSSSYTYDNKTVYYLFDPISSVLGSVRSGYASAWLVSAGAVGAQYASISNYNPVVAWLMVYGGYMPPEDPYGGGGWSYPGGGDGDFNFNSTDIPIPNLPSIGAYATGFISLYKPSASELGTLANYMWSGAFDPDNFKKLFANPMDAILGLHIVPTAGGHPGSSAATLMVGNISTGINMGRVTEQYYSLDCGTVNISPKWGAYLDYSPYSKLSLYLPYIGFVPISPDDCMGGSIKVVYHVDILSGACCAFVYCTSNRGQDGHTLYTFTGACACDCPVTEGQYTNAVLGILNIASGVAGAITGGMTGNPGGVAGGIMDAANAALSMARPDISRSGSFGGSAGLMGIQYPYLVLTVPKMCTPEDQNIYRGYPSFVTVDLADVSGYAEVEITHINSISATAEEVEELRGLLESGVIF